ncbi:hypothetical protein, partial [Bacillus sp. m3-13]|uniref:hypothetical protein n=1 Tax=Bacillus sp. m3-13 TaxID=406124 RepID=UPI001F18AD34
LCRLSQGDFIILPNQSVCVNNFFHFFFSVETMSFVTTNINIPSLEYKGNRFFRLFSLNDNVVIVSLFSA